MTVTKKPRVFVSITVDDLDAREDPTRSERLGGYNFTDEEIRSLIDLVKRVKERSGTPTNIVGCSVEGRIIEIKL